MNGTNVVDHQKCITKALLRIKIEGQKFTKTVTMKFNELITSSYFQ